MFLVVAM